MNEAIQTIRGMANQIASKNADLVMKHLLSKKEFASFENLMKKVKRSKLKTSDKIDKLKLTEEEMSEYAYKFIRKCLY